MTTHVMSRKREVGGRIVFIFALGVIESNLGRKVGVSRVRIFSPTTNICSEFNACSTVFKQVLRTGTMVAEIYGKCRKPLYFDVKEAEVLLSPRW